MNDQELDQAIRELPRQITPPNDLWPHIEKRLTPRDELGAEARASETVAARATGNGHLWGLAATVLLVATASLTTFVATRAHYAPTGMRDALVAQLPAPTDEFTPIAANVLPVDYTMARGELMAILEASLERLDPASRRVVAGTLLEIRAALTTIELALAEDPDNASLQQLLVTTSQQELSLLKSVQRLAQTAQQVIEI
ncbi:MAG: hypothetical protein AAF184_11385 [Pseudomonadota bacterium]